MEFKKNKSGQFFSLDMIIGLLSLIIVILGAVWVWDSVRETIAIKEVRTNLEFVSRNSMAGLIETSGYPHDWYKFTGPDFNRGNIFTIGLCEHNSLLELSQTKIDAMKSSDWETTKRMIGFLGPGYDFNIDLYVWNGSAYSYNDTIGPAMAGPSEILKVTRFALLNDKWTRVEMTAWHE